MQITRLFGKLAKKRLPRSLCALVAGLLPLPAKMFLLLAFAQLINGIYLGVSSYESGQASPSSTLLFLLLAAFISFYRLNQAVSAIRVAVNFR